MRGAINGLPSPHPLGAFLPAVYQEDSFTTRFTAGLDDVLAPVLAVLDCLEAYVDPLLAPADFLDWLAGWVGVEPDEDWPGQRRRRAVAAAVSLHASRGTVAGLGAHLDLVSGGEAEVEDTGGVSWSAVPTAECPSHDPGLRVLVRVPAATESLRRSLEAVILASKPAHVPHVLEVIDDDRVS